VVGSWRSQHDKELCNLFASPNIIRVIKSRKMKWLRHVACMGEMRNAYSILVRKPKGKRPRRRPMCGWEDNIRMDEGSKVGRCGLDVSNSG
jgi:hypothetical protein